MMSPKHRIVPTQRKPWYDHVLEVVDSCLAQNKSLVHHNFHATILPTEVDQYLKLQQAIAARIPHENGRPTIRLIIKGKHRGGPSDMPDFGFIGGVGPLSDANMITQIMKAQTNKDNVYVELLSAPPPRLKSKKGDGFFKHLNVYYSTIKDYLMRPHKKVAMLSNTAHLNWQLMYFFSTPKHRRYKPLIKIANPLIKFVMNKFNKPNAVNLVRHNVKQLKDEDPSKVLILGTLEAAKKKLYPKAMQKIRVPYTLPVNKNNRPDKQPQIQFQSFIDAIKSGKAVEIAPKFLAFIQQQIEIAKPSHLFLACTELGLLLETPLGPNQTVGQALEAWLAGHHPHIKLIDSEALMLKTINQKLARENLNIYEKFKPAEIDNTKQRLNKSIQEHIKRYTKQKLFSRNANLPAKQLLKAIEASDTPQALLGSLQEFFKTKRGKQYSKLKHAVLKAVMDKPLNRQNIDYLKDTFRSEKLHSNFREVSPVRNRFARSRRREF